MLIIYDLAGKIWNIIYGETEIPQGVPWLKANILEGAREGIYEGREV